MDDWSINRGKKRWAKNEWIERQ